MKNTELIYELNLPPVNEIFLDSFIGFEESEEFKNSATTDGHKNHNYQYRTDIETIFKPEWLTFKDFKWDRVLYFCKDNYRGKIHTDIPVTFWDTEYESCTPWGINWVWDGPGLQEYWKFEQVEREYVTGGAHNRSNEVQKGKVWTYSELSPPYKSYDLKPNRAYLINGRFPHRVSGWNNRKVISYRTLEFNMMRSWDEVIERFKDVIL